MMETLTIAVLSFLAGAIVGAWLTWRAGYSTGVADCLAARYGLGRRR